MILYVTNVDTEILALRIAIEALPAGFPPVRAVQTWHFDERGIPDGLAAVIVRLLGGRRSWEAGFDQLADHCRAHGVPLLAFGGEAVPDVELAGCSTVPMPVHADAFRYLQQGGPENLEQLLRYVANRVLGVQFEFAAPIEIPTSGIWRRSDGFDDGRPRVGVVFYRAHLVAGNTHFVDDLVDALERRGAAVVALWCYSLRAAASAPILEQLRDHDIEVLITTVLASGGPTAGAGVVGGPGGLDGDDWDISELAALDVPILQAASSGQSSEQWLDNPNGLGPYDATAGAAIPEMDGRIIAPVFAFNEVVDDGDELGNEVRAYRSVPDRLERLAGLACRFAQLRRTPPADRRIAVVLSAYPSRRGRLANAVGLDTPASALRLLDALAAAGYHIEGQPTDPDSLMALLEDGLVYSRATLSERELARAVGSMSTDHYCRWFATLPGDAQQEIERVWGRVPGGHRIHDDRFVFSGLELGNVLVAIQPPRGYGDDPVAIYHSPGLPPTHHYLAFYRWLDEVWGAHAIVHLGKHGTLEWLPGKPLALTSSCWPDVALADLPLFYPFLVNDPGEGSQAKRRTHAVIIDHLPPPQTRADTYDELARLEQLLDEYSQVQVLDPAKLPALRERIWSTLTDASLDRDLGLDAPPDDDAFDDVLVDVDGYLCGLKDAQIRGGLHVLGVPPTGEAIVDLVLAVTRVDHGRIPALRAVVADELGLDRHDPLALDRIEARCRRLVEAAAARGWQPTADDNPTMRWVCEWLVPNLARAPDELGNLLVGLDGRYVPPGPSGTLTRGGAHVLPTGRNFYTLDPYAVPTPLAWDVGVRLADAVVQRHLAETGEHPRSVGIVVWGTAVLRTQGDDIAQALALLGVRPTWDEQSRRIVGLEPIPLVELGRPRIDVTLRISGFFRDAFAHLVALVDDAVRLVGDLDEPPAENFVRAHGTDDARVFGPAPGAYGSGILDALDSGVWRDELDLAAVYTRWSGWSYRRDAYGVADDAAMRRRFALIDVAVKNQDNREHDIFDAADYLADHGGMIATVRSLTGQDPRGWLGDSSDPARPVVRSLAEEAARVVRTRVLNPRFVEAMRRHGYKGAAELAATVECLFGYDATTGIVDSWMYERVTETYVTDPAMRAFFQRSNPAALAAIAERLLDAIARGLWSADDTTLEELRFAVVEAEGWDEQR